MNIKRLKLPAGINYRDFLPVVWVLLSLLLLLLVAKPQFNKFKVLRLEKQTLEQQLTTLKEQSAKLRSFSASNSLLKNNAEQLARALPDEPAVPTLMNQLQRLANDSGVDLQSIAYGGRTEGGGTLLGSVSIQVAIAGDFEEVSRFLLAVENASRVLDVSNLNLGIDSVAGTASLSVPVQAYYLVPPVVAEATTPITLDLTNSNFTNLMAQVNALKYYDTTIDLKAGIGKVDPFSDDSVGSATSPVPTTLPEQTEASPSESQ